MLKNSQNLYAEMLFKSTAGTYSGAEDLERDFLTREVGIDPNEFRFVDGSGFAPDDLVTPAAMVKLFRWMNAPVRRGFFWTVLATPGEEGTLRRRLVRSLSMFLQNQHRHLHRAYKLFRFLYRKGMRFR